MKSRRPVDLITKFMNIVTMCRGGNVRSVAAKQILSRYLGHEVIAIGADNTSPKTKKLVFDWADKIVVMTQQLKGFIYLEGKETYEEKCIVLDVGNDIWGDPFNEDLQIKIVDILNNPKTGFYHITGGKCIYKNAVLDTIREYKSKLAARNIKDESL